HRCNSITRHAYDIVCNNSRFVSRIIATSPRQYEDLSTKRGIPTRRLELIPHGINLKRFVNRTSSRITNAGPIKVGYLGRLEHEDKGCLYLPGIVQTLVALGTDFHMTIIGDGPDALKLRRRINTYIERGLVTMRGSCPVHSVPTVLNGFDIAIMPS